MNRILLPLRRVRRRLLIHRRLLAALCTGAAVLVGLQAMAPPRPATAPVWTAARSLSPGHMIERADLRRVAFAPASVPAEVAGPRDLVGRIVAAPVVRGAPLSRATVVGEDLVRAHPGRAVVPVRITDPDVAGLLRVGDRIDVLASPAEAPESARLVTSEALVVALPRAGKAPTSAGLPGRLVVLAITDGDIEKIVTAGVSAFVTAVWSH